MARVTADTSDLDKLALQMKAAERNVRSAYRKGLKDVGNEIAVDARYRIAATSPETARSIKVRTRMPATVIVQGGERDKPIGRLLEGKQGRQGVWLHPLFGDKEHWYTERRHPHLYPAYQAKKKDAVKNLKRHVADAMHEAGLKGPG